MPATRQFDETGAPQRRLPGRSGWGIVGQADIAHRVGKSQQIIGWLVSAGSSTTSLIISQPRGAERVCACCWHRS